MNSPVELPEHVWLIVLLVALAVAPGWYAWRRTVTLGSRLSRWNRLVQRAAFAGLVFLSTVATLSLALWKLGLMPATGENASAMPSMEWLAPMCAGWAVITYLVLRATTLNGERHENQS